MKNYPAAQNQFNRDRAYNLQQQDRQDANSRYWNNFNWMQKKYNDTWDYRGNNAGEQLHYTQNPFNWQNSRRVNVEIGSPAWFSSLYGNN